MCLLSTLALALEVFGLGLGREHNVVLSAAVATSVVLGSSSTRRAACVIRYPFLSIMDEQLPPKRAKKAC